MTATSPTADVGNGAASPGTRHRRRWFHSVRRAFFTIGLAGMVAAGIQIFRPASIGDLRAEILAGDATGELRPRDLLNEMRDVLESKQAPLVISQKELNRYISSTLQGSLSTPLSQDHQPGESPVGVLLKLRPGACDLYLDIRVNRHRLTLMLSCEIDHLEKAFTVRMHHGQVGRLPLYGGLLVPGLPAFRSLAKSFAPELDALFRMKRIELLESEVRLHPPTPGS